MHPHICVLTPCSPLNLYSTLIHFAYFRKSKLFLPIQSIPSTKSSSFASGSSCNLSILFKMPLFVRTFLICCAILWLGETTSRFHSDELNSIFEPPICKSFFRRHFACHPDRHIASCSSRVQLWLLYWCALPITIVSITNIIHHHPQSKLTLSARDSYP